MRRSIICDYSHRFYAVRRELPSLDSDKSTSISEQSFNTDWESDAIDKQLDKIDERLDYMDEQLYDLRSRVCMLEGCIEGLEYKQKVAEQQESKAQK